ncbi:hypothetical protein CIT26_00385 [Mesorhizobium temperatum]|uniref:Transposase IS116/IS110/IS902 C-terminal domain-containing protein n=1 Tax=Mesorhizobium temperatum TaxID=241416 RepID=A0A271LWG1_9HYPH|nr:hypothetical protein CIT26_00385 [Mesorhizobium temperatum]
MVGREIDGLISGKKCGRRVAQTPGVGPVGASLLVMKTPEPGAFRSARHVAAWPSLTRKIIHLLTKSGSRRAEYRVSGGWRASIFH